MRQNSVVVASFSCADATSAGRGQPLRPRQRAVHLVTRAQDAAGPRRVALDAERQVRAQADPLSRALGDRRPALAAVERPLGRRAAVVEHRLADELDLHDPAEAAGGAHEQVLAVVVRRRAGVGRHRVLAAPRAHDERLAHLEPPGRHLPRRDEHVRAGLVDPLGRHVDAERREAEVARLAVEQRAEHAGRVERGHAQPLDRAVGRHERAGVAVGQERVVGDRRERRRRRGALLRPRLRRGERALPVALRLGGGGGAHGATIPTRAPRRVIRSG